MTGLPSGAEKGPGLNTAPSLRVRVVLLLSVPRIKPLSGGAYVQVVGGMAGNHSPATWLHLRPAPLSKLDLLGILGQRVAW